MNVADYIRKKEQAQKNASNNQSNASNNQSNANNYQNNQNQNQNMSPQDAIGKYSNMSEGDLMQELFREGSVSSGKISAQELDNFYNSASGYFSEEQRNKMRVLIEQLKRS
jgi:hypothetical protein